MDKLVNPTDRLRESNSVTDTMSRVNDFAAAYRIGRCFGNFAVYEGQLYAIEPILEEDEMGWRCYPTGMVRLVPPSLSEPPEGSSSEPEPVYVQDHNGEWHEAAPSLSEETK